MSELESLHFLTQLVRLCRDLKADAIAGPAMSGAVIAAAAGALTLNDTEPLRALLLGKQDGYYRKTKHAGGAKAMYSAGDSDPQRIVVVDDCITSGDTMMTAIDEIRRRWGRAEIAAVVVNGALWNDGLMRVRDRLPKAVVRRWNLRNGLMNADG